MLAAEDRQASGDPLHSGRRSPSSNVLRKLLLLVIIFFNKLAIGIRLINNLIWTERNVQGQFCLNLKENQLCRECSAPIHVSGEYCCNATALGMNMVNLLIPIGSVSVRCSTLWRVVPMQFPACTRYENKLRGSG